MPDGRGAARGELTKIVGREVATALPLPMAAQVTMTNVAVVTETISRGSVSPSSSSG